MSEYPREYTVVILVETTIGQSRKLTITKDTKAVSPIAALGKALREMKEVHEALVDAYQDDPYRK